MPTIAEFVVVPKTGTAGPAGSVGPQGEAGATGAQGTIGLTGNTGLTGAAGDPGTQGIQGVIGLTGPAGPADRASHTGAQAVSTVTGLQAGLDAKLDDSQASAAGVSMLGATDAAAQTALINAFTSALKGLVPASGGGTANFLRADGQFAAPTAAASTISTTEIAPATSQIIATGLSAYVARSYEITGALSLTINGSSVFEIG